LNSINIPVLVAAGSKEIGSMNKSVSDIVNAIPGSYGILIDGALHNYPWAEYELFNKIVRRWIEAKLPADERIKRI
jgi:pimeloyl-ACP methyl ester carboxylesterase